MPCTVSTRVLPFSVSAATSLLQARRIAGRKHMMISAISMETPSTTQASVDSSQNRNGSRITSVAMSRKVLISFPVRKSRTLKTCET
jgi:hypothetical protein